MSAYLIRVRAEEEQVEGDRGDEVDDEPPAEVVDGNLGRLRKERSNKFGKEGSMGAQRSQEE